MTDSLKEVWGLTEQMKPEDSLKNWKNDDAKGYAEKLIEEYGQPDEVTETMIKWNKLGSFGEGEMETYVLDESIPHDFPAPHRDYVYTTMNIKVDSDMLDTLGHVTGSIIYDGLKETVTARCGSLYANAATMGFVKDMVDGKVPVEDDAAKKEYADRIQKDPLPKFYDNRMNEGVEHMCGHCLDESKMKDLSMKINSITAKMKKDKQMKPFADKFKKDAMKSMDIKKSLEKVLPDYIAGKDIAALVKEAFVTLFTSKLDEGTWAVPETPAQKRDLKKLLSKPLPLGKEGENASDKMYSIIGDDELFDDLYAAGKESPESDARPIIKKAMKRLRIREDSWDSWKLEESTKPDHIKIFNSLKKGDKVEINYDSAIAGGTTKTFVIKTKNKVYKGKVDKVTMYPDGKTGGVKFHLYQYDNRPGVYMAIGDMGASLRDIKKI